MARTNKNDQHPGMDREQKRVMFDNMNFAAAEAYKLLRTNLMFSLPEKPCRVIGVTSSVRGEGKSTTSLNLAYTIAQSGKHVLLIDGDLRLPTVHSKLGIPAAPGLSNLLAGLNIERDCRRPSGYYDNWFILPSGDIPPNPSELLGSQRMQILLEKYAQSFDFIILDLPPVNIVADAMVLAPWLDGLILAVRQNYTSSKELDACMYQIRKIGSRFLGFVMTDATVDKAGGRYGHYGNKYAREDYGYGDGGSGKHQDAFFKAAAGSGESAAAKEQNSEE